MAQIDFVKRDQGNVNARIVAKETKADFRRVEVASIKIHSSFASPDGKRFFIRHFGSFQLSNHFISVIARTRLDHGQIGQVEAAIRSQTDAVGELLDQALEGARALAQAHGITSLASYDTVPLEVEVGVLSSAGRRFLEVLVKLDQLMPLLQTLEIYEVITQQSVDVERAAVKRKVRDLANGARRLVIRLRREMNALSAAPGSSGEGEDAPDAAVAAPTREPEDLQAAGPAADGGDATGPYADQGTLQDQAVSGTPA
jgi:hypothetical protein